jgi:hypothetical protein
MLIIGCAGNDKADLEVRMLVPTGPFIFGGLYFARGPFRSTKSAENIQFHLITYLQIKISDSLPIRRKIPNNNSSLSARDLFIEK